VEISGHDVSPLVLRLVHLTSIDTLYRKAPRAYYPKVVGSNPTPATKRKRGAAFVAVPLAL
jgi:hypothetical protein